MKTRPAEAKARSTRHSPPSNAKPAVRVDRGQKSKPKAVKKAKAKKKVPRKEQVKAWQPCDALLNGHHETFCQKMALGVFSNYSCYLQAYPEETVSAAAARVNASKLLTNANIQARIAWIRAEALKNVKITLEQQLLWYLKVRDTPVGYIDEESPLAQEVQRDEVSMGGAQGQLKRGAADSGNEVETPEMTVTKVKVKTPSKMDAARQIDKLMGFEKPQELNVNLGYEPPGKAMERLAGRGVDVVAILKKAGLVKS